MSYSQIYVERVIEALSQVDPVSYRRIFNGLGIYYRGTQFALLINNRLYFRADEDSRPLYRARAMLPFQPSTASHASDFYQIPDALLDNPAELSHWMRIAVEASAYTEPGEAQDPGQPEVVACVHQPLRQAR